MDTQQTRAMPAPASEPMRGVLAHGRTGGTELSRGPAPKAAPPGPASEPLRGVRDGPRVRGVAVGLVAVTAVVLLARPAEALTVKCLAIIGTNDNTGIDKRIPASVRRALTRTFRFNSYRLHSTASRRAVMNKKVVMPLPGGHSLVVRPLRAKGKGRDRRILLQVDIVKGDRRIVGASVWLKPGRYWLLGGPRADGGALIVALAVTE